MKRTPWEIQSQVVIALLLRELKTRFGANRLGAVWLFLEPAAHIVILMLMFGAIGSQSMAGIEFPIFLMTGIVPFLMFKSIALRIMDGVEGNMALFVYRHVNPMDVFLARMLLEIILYTSVFMLLVLGITWLGLEIGIHRPLEFLLVIIALIVMGLGLGMILSVIAHAAPEAKSLIKISFMPLYFLSAIMYPTSVIPHEYREWLLWNPLLHAVELIHGAFFVNYHLLNDISMGYITGLALVLLFTGFWLYRYRRLAMVAS